jgi:glycosyltransferase involved in cell wall biosynthesis
MLMRNSATPLIALCVCTYNRPLSLEALLSAIGRQRFRRLADADVHLVVIDNSAAASARDVVGGYVHQGRLAATYMHEPRKGLAVARNAALAAARGLGASYAAFIDDDEVPDPEWLEALLAALESHGAAAAIGPVTPLLETQPGSWLPLCAYVDRRAPRDGLVDDGYTCNAILSMDAITRANLHFDARFNETGGEDTYFFKELRDEGLTIAWSESARVHALIPRHRMSTSWILRRWYRTGIIEAHLGRYDPATLKGKAVNFAKGAVRVVAGSARVLGALILSPWRRPDSLIASFYTVCRGAGLIANVFERNYEEYAPTRYR